MHISFAFHTCTYPNKAVEVGKLYMNSKFCVVVMYCTSIYSGNCCAISTHGQFIEVYHVTCILQESACQELWTSRVKACLGGGCGWGIFCVLQFFLQKEPAMLQFYFHDLFPGLHPFETHLCQKEPTMSQFFLQNLFTGCTRWKSTVCKRSLRCPPVLPLYIFFLKRSM